LVSAMKRVFLLLAFLVPLICGCTSDNTGSEQLQSNNTLQVIVLSSGGSPISGVEVDVWSADNANSAPQAYATTGADGIALFNMPLGDVLIGFNSFSEETFPSSIYEFSSYRTPVSIESDFTAVNLTLTPK